MENETSLSDKDILDQVEERIKKFEHFFTSELKESSLTRYERAILKTFLVFQAKGRF